MALCSSVTGQYVVGGPFITAGSPVPFGCGIAGIVSAPGLSRSLEEHEGFWSMHSHYRKVLGFGEWPTKSRARS